MAGILHDVRYAWRVLRQRPGFTATAVITLALGIGANTAMFSVIDAVLLRPLPYSDPDRLVYLNTTSEAAHASLWPISWPNFEDMREQNGALEMMSATRNVTLNLAEGDATERIEGARVSPNLLRLLGSPPGLGRDFIEAEGKPGAPATALLTHGFWQRRFGGDPGIVGRTVGLDGTRCTVVGILPKGLRYPEPTTDVWIPLVVTPAEAIRGNYLLRPIGRLKRGVSLAEANARTEAIAARLAKDYPDDNATMGVHLMPLKDRVVGDSAAPLRVLFIAVGCVLLIACANVASLLLARASGRRAELAVRSALGAGVARLVRQLLIESLLLSLIGAALGLALAWTGLPALTSLDRATLPRAAEISLDLRVLAFTLGVAVLTGVLFGLFPAWHLSRRPVADWIRGGAPMRGGSDAGHRRVLGALVVAEIAVSLVLLAGAGLMTRSLGRLLKVDPGFSPEGLIAFEMGASRAHYPEIKDQAELYRRTVERVASIPGVESAAAVHRLPLFGFSSGTGFEIDGRPTPRGEAGPNADFRVVTPGYFRTMGIRLVEGRQFDDHDAPGSRDVVLVSESVARTHWPSESPVGKRIQLGAIRDRWWTIVGVVGDVKLRGLDKEAGADAVYWTMAQNFFPNALRTVYVVARSKTPLAALEPAVRAAIRQVDAEEGMARPRPVSDVVSDSVSSQRLSAVLLFMFAALAAILAAVGLYGVMSYSVTRRTHELGIRMALGAESADLLRMVLRHGLALVGAGLAIGITAALALTRLIQSMLFDVSASDPVTLAGVSLILAGVALVATWIPARRASRLNPLAALRWE
ncbi:MAG: ABC transporter permease [Acidobacteria bacterium]|nr:ABC transporter permease [Acidobacteriota bacterium]